MEFSRQEYWSRKPFPSPGDHLYPGAEPGSFALKVDSLPSEPPEKAHSSKTVEQSVGMLKTDQNRPKKKKKIHKAKHDMT